MVFENVIQHLPRLRSSVVERITSTSEVYDEVVSSILAEGILFYFLALNAVSFLLFVF